MTGRAAGHCAGYGVRGYTNPIPGRGFRGRGGRGQAAYSGPDKEQELQMLKDQADYFTENLEVIKKRIEQLESKSRTNE
jgi:hypothetical protein